MVLGSSLGFTRCKWFRTVVLLVDGGLSLRENVGLSMKQKEPGGEAVDPAGT
jgi:hypothetical protein